MIDLLNAFLIMTIVCQGITNDIVRYKPSIGNIRLTDVYISISVVDQPAAKLSIKYYYDRKWSKGYTKRNFLFLKIT